MYFLIMSRVVEWDVIELIMPCGTKKWVLLCGSFQEVFKFFVMHKTEMPHVNIMKDVQRKVIKLRTTFFINRTF